MYVKEKLFCLGTNSKKVAPFYPCSKNTFHLFNFLLRKISFWCQITALFISLQHCDNIIQVGFEKKYFANGSPMLAVFGCYNLGPILYYSYLLRLSFESIDPCIQCNLLRIFFTFWRVKIEVPQTSIDCPKC